MILNVVIPMAGLGTRFKNSEFFDPKPLINVDGKAMVNLAIESLPQAWDPILISRPDVFSKASPNDTAIWTTRRVRKVTLDGETRGAACTVLASRSLWAPGPLLVLDSDTFYKDGVLDQFVSEALASGADGAALCFPSSEEHFSYASVGEDQFAQKVVEKEPISQWALTGAYWFRQAGIFEQFAIDALIFDNHQKGEFYLSGILSMLIKKGRKVYCSQIAPEEVTFLGTPPQLRAYLESKDKR